MLWQRGPGADRGLKFILNILVDKKQVPILPLDSRFRGNDGKKLDHRVLELPFHHPLSVYVSVGLWPKKSMLRMKT